MAYHYSSTARERDPHALPDIEVFEMTARDAPDAEQIGCYWWPCSPGYLPDGKPSGPFATYAEALADACENMGDEDG